MLLGRDWRSGRCSKKYGLVYAVLGDEGLDFGDMIGY